LAAEGIVGGDGGGREAAHLVPVVPSRDRCAPMRPSAVPEHPTAKRPVFGPPIEPIWFAPE